MYLSFFWWLYGEYTGITDERSLFEPENLSLPITTEADPVLMLLITLMQR
jgi:hypothetical protein